MISELNHGNNQAYCPQCLETLNGFAAVNADDEGGHRPKEGDVSMCMNCNTALAFNADLTLRFATKAEKQILFEAMGPASDTLHSVDVAEDQFGEEFMAEIFKQLVMYLIDKQGGSIKVDINELQAVIKNKRLGIRAEGDPTNQIMHFELEYKDGEDELQAN